MLCPVLSRMLLLAMRTSTPSHELLNVPTRDSTWARGFVAVAPGDGSAVSSTDVRQTHPRPPGRVTLHVSTDLLVPGLLEKRSHELLTLLLGKRKENKKKGRKKEKLIFFNLWLFFPFSPPCYEWDCHLTFL